MDGRLLDTNIVSYMERGDPLEQVYRPHLNGYPPFIAFMTLGEIRRGVMTANWGVSRTARLDSLLSKMTVLESDDITAHMFAFVHYQRQRAGRPISTADAWIAAVALRHDIELVTHNPRDFEGVPNLRVISEAP